MARAARPRAAARKGRHPAGAVAFDTRLGRCVLAWTGRGVRELHLPDPADGLRRPRPDVGAPGVPAPAAPAQRPEPGLRPVSHLSAAPVWVGTLVRRLARHLDGRLSMFDRVPIDWPEGASDFDLAVWQAARRIPPGVTITYGELAEEAGRPGAARAVGGAMARCPIPLLIPAHRVIAAGRRPGGWTGPGGVPLKIRLLEIEGVQLTRRYS